MISPLSLIITNRRDYMRKTVDKSENSGKINLICKSDDGKKDRYSP